MPLNSGNTKQLECYQKLSISVLSIFSFFLFYQNFIFSDSFAFLHLREVDDLAFQTSLRIFHENISALRFDKVIKLNDYGYGWIFWFSIGVITYPFYLLALLTDFYLPLIVIPREVSLFFTIGTAFYVYKSLSIYTKNEFLKFIALLFLISFPSFGQFATRFSTVPQVMFFSCLTFYFAARKEAYEKSDLKKIAIAAAACVGTKINGALILPLIGLIMADRMGWCVNKENLKKLGYFLLNFVAFAIFFSSPALFLSPFKPKYFTSYLESLQNNSHLALQDGLLPILKSVIEVGYLNFYVAVVALILMLVNIFSKDRAKKDLFFAGAWVIFSLSLLSKIMSMGVSYVINYATVVMYLSVFFVITLDRWKVWGQAIATLLLICSIVFNYKSNLEGEYSNFKYFHLIQNADVVGKIEASEMIKKIIPDPHKNPDQKIFVLMDFRAIFPYSHLERENINVQFAFDNLQIIQNQIEGDYDYISLNKKSPFYSETKFNEFIAQNKDPLLILNQTQSRKLVQKLLNEGRFKNANYEVLVDDKNIIFFGKNNETAINNNRWRQ